ncbi:MAG: hypothetical protein HXY40_18190 [Chloroflexi bacterium]|nr:hypothetical protein [Chloroflexota bacterium]
MSTQTIPQFTPAGRLFITFLGTFNSGDRRAMSGFISENYSPFAILQQSPDARAAEHVALFQQLGRLAVRSIQQLSPLEIDVQAESRTNGQSVSIYMRVAAEPPHQILELVLS